MSSTFTSFGALEKAMQKQLKSAMQEVREMSKSNLDVNLANFYGSGSPTMYKRTLKLANSGDVTKLYSGGNYCEFNLYLQPQNYSTGTYSGQMVLEEANTGGSGILGNPWFWEKTESQIQEVLDGVLKEYFS